MLEAKLACIAAAEAAKPKTCSVQVKPIPGVTNQGGTIVFGGGRTVLHIEEVQELQSPSTWSEHSGIIFSTKKSSNVSTDLSKCGLTYGSDKETNRDVGCASSSNVARSNQKLNVDTSPMVSTSYHSE